ncbi:hypothetical protein CVD28_25495 [Bacillus sp. M6-12]|uniref:methyl-accepting chemotaxis protein n=1 Tax=Bacillus sp. M6-12 TaxID=2054166 RepID=UPI000C784069|nr:methyl-accepting chemotaxis protein [Bacillus sp. M6-12]PLS14878.1 hypothetical protein CVD28_25495 [Bacillus sp. M6-12]
MKTIKAKIRLILFMSIAAVVILISFNVFTAAMQKNVREEDKILYQAVIESKDLKYKMSQTRKFERQYLGNPQLSSANLVFKNIEQVTQDAESLTKKYKNYKEISTQFESINKSATAYANQFEILKKKYEAIGYTEKDGLKGKINTSAADIETYTSGLADKSFAEQYTLIRLYEKQYRATGEQEPYTQYNNLVLSFQEKMNAPGLNTAQQASLKEKFKTYTDSVKTIISSDLDTNTYNIAFDAGGRYIESAATEVEQKVSKEQKNLNEALTEKQNGLATILLVVSALILLLLLGTGYVLLKAINSSVNTLKYGAEKIGNGNLTHRVAMKSKDEMQLLADTFNLMADKVQSSLLGVRNSADKLNSSSQHLAAISEETSAQSNQVNAAIKLVAAGASEQTAELEESNSILKTVSSSILDTEKASDEIAAEALQTEKEGQVGLKTIGSLQKTSEQFLELANHLTMQVQNASNKSHEISSIVGTIQEIAENTDLLALNAAIESARAGDAGRGFAVVAQEVRKLAERSKKEAQNIQDLVKTMNYQMEKLMNEADKFNEYKTIQSNSVVLTKNAFENIVNHVSRISIKVSGIRQAIHDVQLSNSTLVEKMEGIHLISEQSAGTAQEVSASSESQLVAINQVNEAASELSFIANDLQTVVSQFTLDEGNKISSNLESSSKSRGGKKTDRWLKQIKTVNLSTIFKKRPGKKVS